MLIRSECFRVCLVLGISDLGGFGLQGLALMGFIGSQSDLSRPE